jgi:hypothetical protein
MPLFFYELVRKVREVSRLLPWDITNVRIFLFLPNSKTITLKDYKSFYIYEKI